MGKLRPNEILARAEKEGFQKVWQESAQFIPKPQKRISLVADKPGTPHPLYDLIQKMRQSFLNMGFMEIFNPIIVDEAEVYKQFCAIIRKEKSTRMISWRKSPTLLRFWIAKLH